MFDSMLTFLTFPIFKRFNFSFFNHPRPIPPPLPLSFFLAHFLDLFSLSVVFFYSMAVAAAEAGGMSEPRTQHVDAAPSESVSGTPSSSPSPANGLDRSYSNNSLQNPRQDAEIESAEILKSEEYRQLFRLPPEEVLIEDFNCALQENILIQGHMYLFVHFICFYSNIFGFETKRVIPFDEVTSVRKAKTAGLFPNAIEIFAGDKKYFFASFLSRDEAFNIINDGWLRHRNGAIASTEQQETVSESSSQENGFIAIETVNGSEIVDNESRAANLSKDSSSKDGEAMAVPEEHSTVAGIAETVSNNAISGATWNWKEENMDAPKTPEVYTNVAESKFPITVEDFFRYFLSDDAVNFHESFHKRCGDKDLKCTSWHSQEVGYTREKSFQHPIKIYLGAKFGGCHEVQTLRIYKNSHMVLETSQEVSGVPYADYFRVEGRWDVEGDNSELKECCVLRVYVNVAFSKNTIWKGKIVQSTIEECREAYATWINMAHELLKQKNLEKQERASTASEAQTSERNLDSEQKAGGSSESSQETNNPGVQPVASDIVHSIRNIDNQLQGNFIDSMSISCMLRECVTKFRSCLKSQSHLSLFLVIIFAVIFFMQFSILILLSRPQHIHVSTPTDYMNRIEYGVGRSPSDIAWLEKRIHFLKDEMYMVETRLERMRYEHALLKKQLRDLELNK
ncbi:protein VASCULAR ASSOCIATED DEATH 1, chloroplastic isoform X2 [Neltuma alba]|uniref:protein VASCULAR ASSOCIATED DEATH 1, chloroplastic isoform X2 n=1 Tax=Neltuma alba TaxID=207710 RepID=UPI0010A4BCE2|nr:protein VASCULAR ASSOCIATED DEATH 1, chloroplastic-like isoform X2 [Prosopis alba]